MYLSLSLVGHVCSKPGHVTIPDSFECTGAQFKFCKYNVNMHTCTYIYIYIFYTILYTVYGVPGTRIFSNQWWMAGAGHLASLRGTGVGHYETAAPRSLQRQSCEPKVGLPITHQRKQLPSRKIPCTHIHAADAVITHINNTTRAYRDTFIQRHEYTGTLDRWKSDIGFVNAKID